MNRDEPFGGKQMILFGDLAQLPPVVKESELRHLFETKFGGPYFFLSPSIQEARMKLVELTHVYRQSGDLEFINILNEVREGRSEGSVLPSLNQKQRDMLLDVDNPAVVLTATNYAADSMNFECLGRLAGEPIPFHAEIIGKFPQNAYPTEQTVFVKTGARVMILRNDREMEKRYVNGTLGRVVEVDDSTGEVLVNTDEGLDVPISRSTWENIRYEVKDVEEQDPKTGKTRRRRKLQPDVIGAFKQHPLRLAWAMTIHKSQGQTFDQIHIDMGRGAFSHGQTYVALSRCTTLDGLSLGRPLESSDIFIDPQALTYADYFEAAA